MKNISKFIFLSFAGLLCMVISANAQSQKEDVIYLKNGNIIRGLMLELVPEKTIKIQTADGSIFVFQMSEIDKYVKLPLLSNTDELQAPSNTGVTRKRPRGVESWYMYFGIGYANAYYPSELQHDIDLLKGMRGETSVGISLDLLGFYWPLDDNQTILGLIMNGVGDRYTISGDWIQFNQYMIGVSAMRFVNSIIGDGFFFRADFGMAWLWEGSSIGASGGSSIGPGVLFGTGYSIPLSDESRIMIHVNYSFRFINIYSYRALNLSVGILF